MRIASIAIAGAILSGAAPLAAQTPPQAPPAEAKGKVADQDKIICEKQEVLGSRLATRRVCMTRSQWADLRHQNRQEIEKIQVLRGMNSNGQ